jgi:copper chaperone NosL
MLFNQIKFQEMYFCDVTTISEKQYAAEFLNLDGDVFKFDDIGCMANYVAEKKAPVAAFYVVDFDSKRWLKAEEASLIVSPNFHTPMDTGMVDFEDRSPAEQAAAANQGRLISFAEALSGGEP